MSSTTSHDDIVKVIGDDNCINVYVYAIDACNYSCAYCYNETANRRTGQKIDFKALFSYLTELHLNSRKHICLSIIGGEPTLHTSLLSFCAYIHDSCPFISIECFSNFSADLRLYEALMECNVQLKLSYHVQNTRYFGKLDELCKLDKFKDKFFAVILYEPSCASFIIQKCYQYTDICNVCLTKLNSTKDYHVLYSNDSLEAFNICSSDIVPVSQKNIQCTTRNGISIYLTYDQILEFQHSSFTRWMCSAGISSQYIHVNGNISTCHSAFHANHIIGNIRQSKAQTSCMLSKLKPKLCIYSICNCEVDISKYKVFK